VLLEAWIFLQVPFSSVPLNSNGQGASNPVAINAEGEACGYVGWPDPRAARWSSSGVLSVIDPERPSMAHDIQDQGAVVGAAYLVPVWSKMPTLWRDSSWGIVPHFPGAEITGANERGDLVLQWGSITYLLPRSGSPVTLQGYSAALSADAQICGHSLNAKAFRWAEGILHDLPPAPGFDFSFAWDLTPSGIVVGQSTTVKGATRATFWTPDGQPWTLPFTGAARTHSCALAINEQGWIVGWESSTDQADCAASTLESTAHGVLWLHDQAQVLPLSSASDVNARGQIVGTLGAQGIRLDPH